jgi:tetratricopeptide (TPR) repeat protein
MRRLRNYSHRRLRSTEIRSGRTTGRSLQVRLTWLGRYRSRESGTKQLNYSRRSRLRPASKNVFGDRHPTTLNIMSSLASTYTHLGRWKDAEDLFLSVLAKDNEATHKCRDVGITLASLASALSAQGRIGEAEKLNIEAIERSKEILGEEHPDTLKMMGNLATTYSEQGKLEAAELLELQVLEKTKRNVGEGHPSTLASMANLAGTYWDRGKLVEAEGMFQKVTEARKRVLGPDHPKYINWYGQSGVNCRLGDDPQFRGSIQASILTSSHP